MPERPIVGLDFGNTNSCVNYIAEDGELRRVRVATGNPPYDTVLATIVLDPESRNPRVGLDARAQYETTRRGTYLRSFKPELEKQRLRERRWVKGPLRQAGHDWVNEAELFVSEWRLEWSEGKYTREQLVSATGVVAGWLLDRALEQGASPESDVWLGVPVTASTCTRKRLLCGLEEATMGDGSPFFEDFHDVLRRVHFVLEPVALVAAAGDDLEIEGRQNVLIFDNGGGTLDLSLVEFEEGRAGGPPLPVHELAAGGSSEVAGGALDRAFNAALANDPEIADALAGMDPYLRDQAIEACKLGLSTRGSAPLLTDRGRIDVTRTVFEQSVRAVLAEIQMEIERTVKQRARLGIEDVDHVVMTGGSSLVPCVQRLVGDLFPHLDEYHLLHYSPEDVEPGGGVESAITDVAQGLARFARQDSLEQITLWDVAVATGYEARLSPVIRQGTPYRADSDGRPALTTRVPISRGTSDWSALGVYERQLHERYLFGLADIPALPEGCELELTLRRDSVFPALTIYDSAGKVVTRDGLRLGWSEDGSVCADLEQFSDNRLADFMHEDAEFLPDTGFRYFERAPLTRPLRMDDYIEWRLWENGNCLQPTRRRGTITQIKRLEDDTVLEEADSLDVSRFVFRVRDADRHRTLDLRTRYGAVRLAPRPDKHY